MFGSIITCKAFIIHEIIEFPLAHFLKFGHSANLRDYYIKVKTKLRLSV